MSESELIKIAVKSMGLDELKPFNPKEKIIEYMIAGEDEKQLATMSIEKFADETASESPAPGGGSVSAYVAALGVSLGTMVANLSSHKRGWDERWEEYSKWAEKGQALKEELLFLVDEDTRSFNRIMEAFKLPKKTEEDKEARQQAIQAATKYAIEVPFRVMKKALQSMDVMEIMAEKGLQSSASDAAVGALCARMAVRGAFLNVKINAADLEDKDFYEKIYKEGIELEEAARKKEETIVKMVEKTIAGS